MTGSFGEHFGTKRAITNVSIVALSVMILSRVAGSGRQTVPSRGDVDSGNGETSVGCWALGD